MADCSLCQQPLGKWRWRCRKCGSCEECCECGFGQMAPEDLFDADELGLDPEEHDLAIAERKRERNAELDNRRL